MMTREPQPGYEYKYYGWYGPATPTSHVVGGLLTFFVVIPLVLLALVALVFLVILAIAVPPVGIALLSGGNS